MHLNNLTQRKARQEGCSPLRLSQRTRLNDNGGGTGTPAECSTAMIKVKVTPVLLRQARMFAVCVMKKPNGLFWVDLLSLKKGGKRRLNTELKSYTQSICKVTWELASSPKAGNGEATIWKNQEQSDLTETLTDVCALWLLHCWGNGTTEHIDISICEKNK